MTDPADTSSPPVTESTRRTGSTWAAVAIIAVAAILAMSRLLGSEFFEIDDPRNISLNPDFASPTIAGIVHHWTRTQMGLYIPVTYTVWHAIAMLTGYASPDALGQVVPAMPYKATNLAVHIACASLAFALFRRWLTWRGPGDESARGSSRAWVGSLLGALVIAVHPVQVETIAWGSGLKDLLMAALSLATMLCYTRSVERSIAAGKAVADWKLHSIAVAFMLAAMLSKPTAMVVPVLLVAIDLLVYRRSWRDIGIAVAPFLPIAVALAALARVVQPSGNMSQIVAIPLRPLMATDAIAFYLGNLVWPQSLAFDYGRTQRVALASGTPYWSWTIVVAIAGGLAWLAWTRKDWRWLLPIALFVVPLGPVLGLAPFDYMDVSAVADHYLALPIAGVGLLVALAIGSLRGAALRPACGAAIVSIVALAVRSNLQSAHWRDPLTYLDHAIAVNPNSWQTISVRSNYLFTRTLARADKLTLDQLKAEFAPAAELARRSIDLYQARDGMAEIRKLLPRAYPRAAVDHFRLAMMDRIVAEHPGTDPAERERLLAQAQRNAVEAFSARSDEPIYWRFAVDIYVLRGNADLASRALAKLKELEPAAPDLDDLAARIARLPATRPTTLPAP
jgi:hypothetical protein